MCTGKQMKVKPIQGQSLFVEQQCCGSGSGRIRTFLPDPDPVKFSGSGSGSPDLDLHRENGEKMVLDRLNKFKHKLKKRSFT